MNLPDNLDDCHERIRELEAAIRNIVRPFRASEFCPVPRRTIDQAILDAQAELDPEDGL